MASDKLQKILEMSKNMDKKSMKSSHSLSKNVKQPISLQGQISNADKTIANIDEMFNSPYIPTQEEKEAWNTERGREELTEMSNKDVFLEKLSKSKLPTAIIESMRNNPCNYEASMVDNMMGPENALFKKLNEAYAKDKEAPVSGVKAVQKINEQLDSKDKDRKNAENLSETVQNNSFSLSQLEEMIEHIIDKKLNSLNENIQHNQPNIKTMFLTENGNFRFLDSADNVYECQMKYLGKRKKKK